MQSKTPERFTDDREDYSVFWDKILVVCPHCSCCAQAVALDPDDICAMRQLTCLACGFSKKWNASQATAFQNGPVDNRINLYQHLPLWLETSCMGERLWFYNERHMEMLEKFVSAKHRERRRDEKHGWRNASMASRLPVWIQSAKNREQILHCIAKLKQKLPGAN